MRTTLSRSSDSVCSALARTRGGLDSARLAESVAARRYILMITTGTPLDMTSNIEQSYIQGREIDMNDIQKHFFKKYMEKIKQQGTKVAM